MSDTNTNPYTPPQAGLDTTQTRETRPNVPNLKLRRILETLFLAVFIVGVNNDGQRLYVFFTRFPMKIFDFNFTFHGPLPTINTLALGYLFSFMATLSQKHVRYPWLRKISICISLLGLTSLASEFLRFFLNYGFHFWISFPLLLVLIDWALTLGKIPQSSELPSNVPQA